MSSIYYKDSTSASNFDLSLTDAVIKEASEKILKEDGVFEVILESLDKKVSELLGSDGGKQWIEDLVTKKIQICEVTIRSDIQILREEVKREIEQLRNTLNNLLDKLRNNRIADFPRIYGDISKRLNDLEKKVGI